MTTPAASQRPKLGIIAGGGRLPVLVAEACRATRRPYFIIAIADFASEADLAAFGYERLPLGALGRSIELLRANSCREIVMAGEVRRPNFSSLQLDRRAVKLLPKFLSKAARGDDALLRILVEAYEEEGFSVCGADDVVAELLMPPRILGKIVPRQEDERDIIRGIDAVAQLGRLDIGQAAVVVNQLVLAVEAVEGTDAMLERCRDLPEALRGTASARRGVLVKMPKPAQERRVDLPTIGLRTIEQAAAIGLAGVAAESGGVLCLDREAMIALADAEGLFITGVPGVRSVR